MQFDQNKWQTKPYQQRIDKPWGYELIYSPDFAESTGKILHVFAGKRLSLQYHDTKTETLCLIKGKAKIVLSNNQDQLEEILMELNKGYYIAIGQKHRVIAISDCDLLESSTPEKGNTYRIEDDSHRPTETEELRSSPNRGWINK
ncbi:hypothetical protein A2313_03135 [Candidatus Roizmanbacteria bacterium RIFOXYB2_FULL_41_10]|uniref:Mannose-6-phosphate isomerase type II C-terminal domain-containing protein n=1 Tax=Candidatus Roizmanbacteria bacterium RIFOXYA1_FULL_41_12 TaxID=1802082 RepID=A0A1F7K9W8_9BACT|nr:MAG: hypothetical protein A2262_02820 [Candidatus Roizmanbacteria bacterium RIFOXYA2_FULL_41_8]OGK64635.1 MAG: hypothetical protein A2209_03535 [Candidatus Roizmanbacteria bacterium RIFOXYA1_FULL_41_12]OGK67181.1 MAG: hypothetical protein A2377_00915 [Candidatus Roizmanbacteria bacterium RIFOXYB1_FULL_41_27]OGK71114.1 MAG: hypothetical protein A2403_02610 [Candidatus Roizmanbacteria bacterium RIFOXYC1_FULL_41_16]OGK72244.1 MAG: hypothetical protein A2313_03135 [Candidatus Roizmanbacteria bac